jgi:uncharacterized membrane protein
MNFDLQTLGIAMGSAWLSGINLYLTVLTLGLLQRFGVVNLPGDLNYLGHWWILGVAGVLAAVEFIADKIPAVDSIWDAIHTFIRIPAGAVLAATAFAHFDPTIRLLAVLLGGSLALSSHGAKAATRLAANASPEPFSNLLLSLFGDLVAVCGSLLLAISPTVILFVVIAAVILSVILFRWVYRALQRMFGYNKSSVLTQ